MYLPPDTYQFPIRQRSPRKPKREQQEEEDEERFPEAYRKTVYVKGSNLDVPKAFQIGMCAYVIMCIACSRCDLLYRLRAYSGDIQETSLWQAGDQP